MPRVASARRRSSSRFGGVTASSSMLASWSRRPEGVDRASKSEIAQASDGTSAPLRSIQAISTPHRNGPRTVTRAKNSRFNSERLKSASTTCRLPSDTLSASARYWRGAAPLPFFRHDGQALICVSACLWRTRHPSLSRRNTMVTRNSCFDRSPVRPPMRASIISF